MRVYLVILLALLNVFVWLYILFSPSPNTIKTPLPHKEDTVLQQADLLPTNPLPNKDTLLIAAHKPKEPTHLAATTPLPIADIGKITPIENLTAYLSNFGLSNAQTLDSSLQVDLRYSSNNNFIGQTLYADLQYCYVLPRTAQMLAQAQSKLRTIAPEYRLLLLDCTRPSRVQQQLWNAVKHRPDMRRYVAPPQYGSLHNFGAAVDVTLVDTQGREVDMGTPFDFMGELAQPRHQARFLKNGQLTATQVNNRLLLRRVMREAGFKGIQSEWWHFNICSIDEARKKYKKVE